MRGGSANGDFFADTLTPLSSLRPEMSTRSDGAASRTFIAGISGTTLGGAAQPVVVKSNGQLGTAAARSADPLDATVRRLVAQVEQQQGQIDRLREQLKRGG